MNQILLTGNQNNRNNNRNNENNSENKKKIIIFFGVSMIIFAVILIGVFVFKTYNSYLFIERPEDIAPTLSLEEMDGKVKIISATLSGINKIIYQWNDEEPEEIEMYGRNNYEEAIDIPEGENILTVKIVGENGKETETTNTFIKEENTEIPKIEIDNDILTRTGKVRIIVTDNNNGIKYMTYQWNDEDETRIDAEGENETTLETTIDVKRGENILKIKCINNIDKENYLEKRLKGINEPKIEVTKDDSQGQMYMTIKHDIGFEKIEFTVNGREYAYDSNYSGYDPDLKEISYKFNLAEGENTVIIHAISLEGSEKTYKGKCNYTPQ